MWFHMWFGVTLLEILIKMCPSQLRQICPSNLSHTASPLYQVGCWWTDPRRSRRLASKKLRNLSPVHQKSDSVTQTVPLFYPWTASSLRYVGLHKHLSAKESEQHHHPRVVFPTMTASSWTHICFIILHDNFVALLQHFVRVIQVLGYIHYKCKVLHPFCGLNSSHWFALFFHELTVQFPLVNQRNASTRHLGLTILRWCGMADDSCGLSLWEGCETPGDSGLWIGWN